MQYFSVWLDKVLCLNYLGIETTGWVCLKCKKDSVIYQTYKNVDVIDELKFPVKAVELPKINQ